mgnify:CR=1 FL=1
MTEARDLLVCDLDGTLVDKSLELDPDLVEAFHRAAERGLLISLATGRMPPGAERYRAELGITAPSIYYNGALVREAAIAGKSSTLIDRTYAERPMHAPSTTSRRHDGRDVAHRSTSKHARSNATLGTSDITRLAM